MEKQYLTFIIGLLIGFLASIIVVSYFLQGMICMTESDFERLVNLASIFL